MESLILEEKSRGTCIYVFGAVVCKIQAKEALHRVLTIIPKDKRSLFSEGERSVSCTAASWSCICPPEIGRLIDIWKPSIAVCF